MPTIKIDIDNDSINNPIIDDRCSLLIDKINIRYYFFLYK